MSNGQHILICDDEIDLREMVGEYLERRGYRVTLTEGGIALEAALDANADVSAVILDINMPREDGLSILRRLRNDRNVCVIMLTIEGDVVDRIVGLEMGADDYLPKPVDLRELEARLKAVLRRSATKPTTSPLSDSTIADDVIGFCGFKLDLTAAKLFDRNNVEIILTAMEFRLLRVFVENQKRVMNRDQLLELAHDRGWDPFDRSIDIRVSRLRRKIETNPAKPEIIRTVRGIGYIFAPDET